jgi:hypothetical protein
MWVPALKFTEAIEVHISHRWRDGRCKCQNCYVRSSDKYSNGIPLITFQVLRDKEYIVNTYLCTPCIPKIMEKLYR